MFYIGPIIGWSGNGETRILVESESTSDLYTWISVNDNEFEQLEVKRLNRGKPLVYIIQGAMVGNKIKLRWRKSTLQGEILEITHRVPNIQKNDRYTLESYLPAKGTRSRYLDIDNIDYMKVNVKSSFSWVVLESNADVAIVSCNGYGILSGEDIPTTSREWDQLSNEEPNVVIHLGDQVYLDGIEKKFLADELDEEGTRDAIREVYHKTWKVPGTERILRSASNIMVLDDHDIRDDTSSFEYTPGIFDKLKSSRDEMIDIGYLGACPKLKIFDQMTDEFYRMYQQSLYGEGEYDFNIGNGRYIILDGRSRRTKESYFGPGVLDKVLPTLDSNDINYILTQSTPFVYKKGILNFLHVLNADAQHLWTYREGWVEDARRLFEAMDGLNGAFIGGDINMGQRVIINTPSGNSIPWYTTSSITTTGSNWVYHVSMSLFQETEFNGYVATIVEQIIPRNYLLITHGDIELKVIT
jgi:hypothetical protein